MQGAIAMSNRGHLGPRNDKIKPRPSETPPREPTATDRRNIFRHLDEVYDERGMQYCAPSTDQTVAAALGVPWAWVAAVREANFGPPGPPNEMKQIIAELSAARKELAEFMEVLMTGAAACELRLNDIDAKRKEWAKALEVFNARPE